LPAALVVMIWPAAAQPLADPGPNDPEYGFSKTNPIEVGDDVSGPHAERVYLDGLRDAAGKKVRFTRLRSVGAGPDEHILDLYEITTSSGEKVHLFLDMYHPENAPETQPAPKGFHRGSSRILFNEKATRLRQRGDFKAALALAEKELKSAEAEFGADDPETVSSLNVLGLVYQDLGEYARAEPFLRKALRICDDKLDPASYDTASTAGNLGGLYQYMGDYAKAEPLYRRALEIDEKHGPDTLSVAKTLNNLGELYREMGSYDKAEPLFKRSLEIKEAMLGPDEPELALSIATGLNNLATLYRDLGKPKEAEPLYQRVVEIQEKILGPKHPRLAETISNLAGAYVELKDTKKAQALFMRSVEIFEDALGRDHPFTAKAINNLATICHDMGLNEEAESLYRRALEVNEKTLGPEHPTTASVLENLALLNMDVGKKQIAHDLALRAVKASETEIRNILSFTSEQQRLAFQADIHHTHWLGLLTAMGTPAEIAQSVLRNKGVVLDSLLEDREVAEASRDPRQHELVSALQNAKQRLMQLQLEIPKDVSPEALKKRTAERETLSRETEKLEGELAVNVAGLGRVRRALNVTLGQVQKALSNSEVLVEFIRYDHIAGGNQRIESWYGAIVITRDREPQWVPFGVAAEIEKKIRLYQRSVRGETDEPTLKKVLQSLFAELWAPLEKAFPPETKSIIISPDGELSFVSFATLTGTDDKFLSEKYSIRYLASGRDLLRETKASPDPSTVVYANPDFTAEMAALPERNSSDVAMRSAEMRDLENISLRPLPGTEGEASELEKRSRESTRVFIGSKATEAQLRQVQSPSVLHLATHGFFLPEANLENKQAGPLEHKPEIPKSNLVNPMHRSGIALAGAQTTLRAWARGEVPPTENDGVVTAEEVGGLKLSGTWLVVLSACDTGSGEARAGEGVMGLRRGFVQAGAQNLLMTLWPISDQTTVRIMLDFYAAADKTRNAPQALSTVQREWLVKLRQEKGLLAAVRLAGPFIMSSQGKAE
jgi:tetratricopeptide (TPR) repeat protein